MNQQPIAPENSKIIIISIIGGIILFTGIIAFYGFTHQKDGKVQPSPLPSVISPQRSSYLAPSPRPSALISPKPSAISSPTQTPGMIANRQGYAKSVICYDNIPTEITNEYLKQYNQSQVLVSADATGNYPDYYLITQKTKIEFDGQSVDCKAADSKLQAAETKRVIVTYIKQNTDMGGYVNIAQEIKF